MKNFISTFFFLLSALCLFASQYKKTVELRMQSQFGNLCDASIYFDQGISPVYDSLQDEIMIFNEVPGAPEIYSYTLDKIPCSINGAGPFNSAQTVALGYHVSVNGIYIISAIGIDNFSPTTIIRLQDTQLDSIIDLRENFYQVQLDSTDVTEGRFNLLISYPVQFSSLPSNCSNNGGIISLTTDSTIIWNTCSLYSDTPLQLIAIDSNVNGSHSFNNLAAGSYTLQFNYNLYTAIQPFYLVGNYIVASIGVPASQIYTLEDVVFSGISTNSNHYSWSFGDGTLIDGVANPTQTYYVPGTYTVNFSCSNDSGCTATAQATVIVLTPTGISNPAGKDISITNSGSNVMVNMNGVPNNGAEMQIFNLLGQSIYSERITSQNEVVSVDGHAPGYYLVSVTNADKVNTKRIFFPK